MTPTSENSIFRIAGQIDPQAEPLCGGKNVGLYVKPIGTLMWCTDALATISSRLDDALVSFDIEEGTRIDEKGLKSISQVWLHELMHALLDCECRTFSRRAQRVAAAPCERVSQLMFAHIVRDEPAVDLGTQPTSVLWGI